MSKQNFKSQAKRKRELAKLDKRQAKDQKRALRKAEQRTAEPIAVAASPTSPLQPSRMSSGPPEAPKPLSLAEVVQRWKNTRIAKPKRR